MSEELRRLIRAHGESVRVWRSREHGYFGKLRGAVIRVGRLDDGRWYVVREKHDTTGPWKAQLYATEADAVRVARAVMADAQPDLTEAGYGRYSEAY